MAVGPTEALAGPSLYRISGEQRDISRQVLTLMQRAMIGVRTARINPDAAIPPAANMAAESTKGIGTRLDLEA